MRNAPSLQLNTLLVGRIVCRESKLPEMQREYVWRATSVRDLLDSLYQGYLFGAIRVRESDETIVTRELEGRNSRSGAFKTMFLAFRTYNAADWKTKLKISARRHGKSDVIEYHHVSPQAQLKKSGVVDTFLSERRLAIVKRPNEFLGLNGGEDV
jgi:hypothetical protein